MADLLGNGDPRGVALVDARGCVTREELGTRAMARAAELRLAERSVVVLTGTTSLELVITYLALLDAGHVPLLTGGHVSRIVDRWNPAAVVEVGDDDVHVARRRGQGHPLHPDLALLLGTSGSTGSPKLVRLSRRNVASNASAIAAYLGLRPEDRGITTLPLHYCYGLSVLHSHLAAGASIVLNEASVVDPCFTTALRRHGVTNVAGVPHTFDLLERSGPERLRAPSMRFVTQAGGRMPAAAVERWLHRTEEWGVDFYVMYGQTEATA